MLPQSGKDLLKDTNCEIYCYHLEAIRNDIRNRFNDLQEPKIPEWVVDPFETT